MANDINNIVIVGNLVRDCELKYMQTGTAIGNISIACNRSKKQADGTYTSEVSYFDVVLFGKTAENLKQYLTKGKKVAVQGFLKQDRWTDQQGNNRSRVSIIAENLELLGGGQGENNGGYQQSQPAFGAQQNYGQPQAPQQMFTPVQQPAQPGFQQDMPFTEDIPF